MHAGILLDLQGPKIRLGCFEEGHAMTPAASSWRRTSGGSVDGPRVATILVLGILENYFDRRGRVFAWRAETGAKRHPGTGPRGPGTDRTASEFPAKGARKFMAVLSVPGHLLLGNVVGEIELQHDAVAL